MSGLEGVTKSNKFCWGDGSNSIRVWKGRVKIFVKLTIIIESGILFDNIWAIFET